MYWVPQRFIGPRYPRTPCVGPLSTFTGSSTSLRWGELTFVPSVNLATSTVVGLWDGRPDLSREYFTKFPRRPSSRCFRRTQIRVVRFAMKGRKSSIVWRRSTLKRTTEQSRRPSVPFRLTPTTELLPFSFLLDFWQRGIPLSTRTAVYSNDKFLGLWFYFPDPWRKSRSALSPRRTYGTTSPTPHCVPVPRLTSRLWPFLQEHHTSVPCTPHTVMVWLQ